jgi:hypothetical protein
MNRIEFTIITGYIAGEDDLKRANCKKSGDIGHYDCGVCKHNVPKFFVCDKCVKNKQRRIHRRKYG